jgi:hypothetical protein
VRALRLSTYSIEKRKKSILEILRAKVRRIFLVGMMNLCGKPYGHVIRDFFGLPDLEN